jgi:iron complex transport system ATP-binding protein
VQLQIDSVEFAYRSKPILNRISFTVQTGDFVALVGPNGSGKSTLLRVIDGILKAQTGCVLMNGRNTRGLTGAALARQVGYVPQSEGTGFPVNVFETILMGRKPYMSWAPGESDLQKTAQVIEELHLNDLALTNLDQLSGGQRQKVLIGRALAQDTPLLLLDEPTASLDLKHQLEVLELLKTQTRKGTTVIVAIHDLNLAARYGNKIIMLHQGAIFAAGGVEVLNQPNIEAVYEVQVKLIRDNDRLVVIPEQKAGEKVG